MKLAINFLKKNFCTWPKRRLGVKGLSYYSRKLEKHLHHSSLKLPSIKPLRVQWLKPHHS